MEVIRSGNAAVTLRPASPADRDRFEQILGRPEVARWWGDPAAEAAELMQPEDGVSVYAIEASGDTVGFIQSVEELTPAYRHAGIDIAVDPDFHRRGIGTAAILTLARRLISERGHHRLTIDPAMANTAAISVYARLGFRPVGVLRQYERGPDGIWRDGLLMDLLAAELRSPRPG